MTSQFSQSITRMLSLSREEAVRLASVDVEPEHLMLGIMRMKESEVNGALRALHVDMGALKQEMETTLCQDTTFVMDSSSTEELPLAQKTNNIMRLSVLEARLQRQPEIDETHIMLAILHDQLNNSVKRNLELQGVTYDKMREQMKQKAHTPKNDIALPDDEELENEEAAARQSGSTTKTDTANGQEKKSKTPIIDNFGTDLTKAAAEGKLDPVIGREREIMRVVEIIGRRKKNNPILIGEPGVGKTAIVEALAQMIATQSISPTLIGKRVINLDMTAMVAGTKYRGQFEERMKQLIKEAETNPNIILFIDEIHTIIGAGSAAGTMDAANIIKPALARGKMQCIGSTTLDEYRKSIEKDGALERRFQKVMVEPTTTEHTLQILQNLKDRYEQHHHVRYTDEALAACVKLTDRYINDRQFPDKAIDAMDEAGSRVHINSSKVPPEIKELENQVNAILEQKELAAKHQNFELAAAYRDRQTELEISLAQKKDEWKNGAGIFTATVNEDDVAGVVSMFSGVPAQRLAEKEGTRLREMGARLKEAVIAQDKAIDKTVKAIQRNRVGLKSRNRPVGVFMFLGPTGVGKTHLTKKLAEEMFGSSKSLIRIDMSEYSESFNTSRLVGAPPGYVGYDEGGQLTERVRRHPYSIVLLDEIEKAHGNVFNMLLQVMDEGRMTDGNGRLIDFSNTIIVMTSNAGTRQLKDFAHGVGFNATKAGIALDEKDKEYARSIIQKALSRQFSPEFLNRIDEIITFDQLDLDAIKRIIDVEMKDLVKRVEDLGYKVALTDAAKDFIASKGYDVQFGARPLRRALQTYVEDELCELILNEALKPGATVTFDKLDKDEKLTITLT